MSPETIEAGLQLSEAALVGLGMPTGPVIASIGSWLMLRQLRVKGATSCSTIFGTRRTLRRTVSGAPTGYMTKLLI